MAFCSSCGTKNQDNSKFCCGCGAPLNAGEIREESVNGIRTEKELLNFLRTNVNFSDTLIKMEKKAIPMMIEALFPNEVIEFAGIGRLYAGVASAAGTPVGYAFTNRRLLLVFHANASHMLNNALKLKKNVQAVQSYSYDQICDVFANKKLLTGTVTIECQNENLPITLDRPYVDAVYQGIREVIHRHCV